VYIISNTKRERGREKRRETVLNCYSILPSSSPPSTNQIKGNYRKEKIERERKKKKMHRYEIQQ
jgi:hypothetical protein